jgi:hypothetical protein
MSLGTLERLTSPGQSLLMNIIMPVMLRLLEALVLAQQV